MLICAAADMVLVNQSREHSYLVSACGTLLDCVVVPYKEFCILGNYPDKFINISAKME